MAVVRDLGEGFGIITNFAAVVIMSKAPDRVGTIGRGQIDFTRPRESAIWRIGHIPRDKNRCIGIRHRVQPRQMVGIAPVIGR